MCNQDTLSWIEKSLKEEDVKGKAVLEVGALDINGSVRPIISALCPKEYIGTDIKPGPGVDILCPAEQLVSRFDRNRFDLVISTCTLEHIRSWREAVSNMKQICKPSGLILIAVPSKWPFHAFPNDYWRYDPSDIHHIFSDCRIELLEEDRKPCSLVYAKIIKPKDFVERDLNDYALYSVIRDKRTNEIRAIDFFTPRFAAAFLRYFFHSKL